MERRKESLKAGPLLLVFCLLTSKVTDVQSFGTGAPDIADACQDMYPTGHQVSPQDTESPYSISLSSDVYSPNGTIDVTISSNDGSLFKGFIIQARLADPTADQGPAYGYFTPESEGRSQHNCPQFHDEGASLTHTSVNRDDPQQSLTFTWTAPGDYVGHLQFRATVVQLVKEVYWRLLMSDVLIDPTAPTLSPVEGTEPPMPTGTVPNIDLTECGRSKGCYREPSGCDQLDCEYLLTWVSLEEEEVVDFEISVKLHDDIHWAAMGLSYDTSMGDDSVVDCLRDAVSGEVIVQMSFNYNNGGQRSNEPLDDTTLGLIKDSLEGFYDGDYIMCRYSRVVDINHTDAVIFSDVGKVFVLDEDYYIFIGRGPVLSGRVKSRHLTIPMISPEKVNVASDSYVDIGGTQGFPLIQAHGSLMVFAWMVFASFGVLMPRYFKPAWPEHTFLGKQIWFQIHQPCMCLVVLLTITAFIIIFIEVGGYAQYGDNLPSALHPPLGICVTILAILNPIGALFRPAPDHKYRPIFNWVHFSCGTLAHILAAATMFIACYMSKARLPDYSKVIVTVFICWHVTIEIILAVHSHWLKRKGASVQVTSADIVLQTAPHTPSKHLANGAGKGNEALSDSNGTLDTSALGSTEDFPALKAPPGSEFKTAVISVHGLGVLSLGIAMVFSICTV